ncbi:hypothetical protein GCM10023339_05190 [Alloalcanivorax gelatiniphagus]
MASWLSSVPSVVTRSQTVSSTTTDENMTTLDARVTWGGRAVVGLLTGPLSPLPPNGGYLRVVLRDQRGPVPDVRAPRRREG